MNSQETSNSPHFVTCYRTPFHTHPTHHCNCNVFIVPTGYWLHSVCSRKSCLQLCFLIDSTAFDEAGSLTSICLYSLDLFSIIIIIVNLLFVCCCLLAMLDAWRPSLECIYVGICRTRVCYYSNFVLCRLHLRWNMSKIFFSPSDSFVWTSFCCLVTCTGIFYKEKSLEGHQNQNGWLLYGSKALFL